MNELSQPRSSVTRIRVCIAAAGALACAAAAAAPPPDPLVERVLAAHGGREALARVKVVRERGRVVATAMGRKEGALTRILALPGSLRVETAYPDGTGEVRIAHEGRATREGADVTGTPPGAAMLLQAARLALPFWLAADPSRAHASGAVTRDGKRFETLAVDLPGGLALVGEVDPESGRIVRTVGFMEGPGGGRFEFANTYGGWKRVGGVWFATREDNFAGGRHTGETTLEQVELLPAAPPGAFTREAKRL